MRYTLALVLCVALVQGNLPAQPEIANKFVYRSDTYNGMTLPYRLFIPDGYSSAVHYPLMLALHGAGDRGTDNNIEMWCTQTAITWTAPDFRTARSTWRSGVTRTFSLQRFQAPGIRMESGVPPKIILSFPRGCSTSTGSSRGR